MVTPSSLGAWLIAATEYLNGREEPYTIHNCHIDGWIIAIALEDTNGSYSAFVTPRNKRGGEDFEEAVRDEVFAKILDAHAKRKNPKASKPKCDTSRLLDESRKRVAEIESRQAA
jgi:hypothetical protein